MEKAKAFFLICAGVLILSVAMDIGTEQARADFDPDAGGPAVGMSGNDILYENGEVWFFSNYEGEWQLSPEQTPPIPLSEIAFWNTTNLVATNGDYWVRSGNTWTNHGLPPFNTPAETSNWSNLKSSFGK
jgi:hypothetical protein